MIEYQDDRPLFPKILWNRPINRAAAGRLLVAGGQKNSFSDLQAVYAAAAASGIGSLTLLAPDRLRPMLGTIPEIDFAPSTNSGSLAKASLAQLMELSAFADTTLIGPDLSNNSETAILMESFIDKYQRSLVITQDMLEVVGLSPDKIRSRPNTLLILTMQQLFKLANSLRLPIQISPEAGIIAKIEILKDFWEILRIDLALVGPELIIKTDQQASVTKLPSHPGQLLPISSGVLSVSYAQNPHNHYEGLTTSAFLLRAATAGAVSVDAICRAIAQAIQAHEES
jgi:hypothetical protein